MPKSQKAESELILNDDGSVYHLNLKAENIANTVFLVGDPGRVSKVSKHFDFIDFETSHREFITHTGRIGGKRDSVLTTGIGTDNIDIVVNELEAAVNIDPVNHVPKEEKRKLRLIRIGTSGAIQPDIPVNEFVCSSHGLGFDGLVHYYEFNQSDEDRHINEQIINYLNWSKDLSTPYVFEGSRELFGMLKPDNHVGITATTTGFYGPQGRSVNLPLRNVDMFKILQKFKFHDLRITNFEMETSALYGLSQMLGHEACSISVILANRARQEFSSDPGLAVERLIKQVLERLI